MTKGQPNRIRFWCMAVAMVCAVLVLILDCRSALAGGHPNWAVLAAIIPVIAANAATWPRKKGARAKDPESRVRLW